MIPRIVHYCWFGNTPLDPVQRRCVESWQTALPGFTLKRWDESNAPLDHKYAEECLRRKLWSRLSNFVRLRLLSAEGGIYLDTDVEVIRDLTPLLENECFLGFQQQEPHADWVNVAVLGSVSGHPFIGRCMDRLLDVFEKTGQFARGPSIATAVLREMGLRSYGLQRIEGVAVYPIAYFYPYSWLEDYSPGKIARDTYCVHHWVASWKSGFRVEVPRPLRRLRRAVSAWLRKHRQPGHE